MRLKSALAVLFLSILPLAALAQTPAPSARRPYEVSSYNLTMDWRPVFRNKTQIFSGHNQIVVRLDSTTPAIVLDAAEMVIDSVKINGEFIATPIAIADTVSIPLTLAEQQKGTALTLDVYYTRNSATDDGMYFYPKGLFVGFGAVHDSVFVEESLAYTMSEPSDARKWMPCNDAPYNKANSAISIIVPAGYSAQSNGTLQSVDTNGDGSLTFNWKSDRPIATYLMCGDASKWMTWRDYYHRLSNQNDSVPVIYFAWASDYNAMDTTGIAHNAHYAFRNTPRMIANDSKLFGEYPFKQYGQVPLQPFGFGGMEHQTMTSIDRSILHGTNEDVIAHELFHQWFGDKTTCETWADIWLNEGFATLGEALWEE
ncbi:MAG: M1 family aminopeptidase, partial [Candidatus Kapaibacterium sp.]